MLACLINTFIPSTTPFVLLVIGNFGATNNGIRTRVPQRRRLKQSVSTERTTTDGPATKLNLGKYLHIT